MNVGSRRCTHLVAHAAFLCVVLLSSSGGAHGWKWESYEGSACAGANTQEYDEGNSFADGSAFTGDIPLNQCYGWTTSFGTKYYKDTYDADLNAVTYVTYNTSTCTPELALSAGTGSELCGKCQSSCSRTGNYDNTTATAPSWVNCTNGQEDVSWKVTGCPVPPTESLPTLYTILRDNTYAWVNYDDEQCTQGAKPSDPHFVQMSTWDPFNTKYDWMATGYEIPLDTCYDMRSKKIYVTDPWVVEQCIDTYDPSTHTLQLKCYQESSTARCDETQSNVTYSETKKCGVCDKGELVLCPYIIPPMQKMDPVPTGKFAQRSFKGPGCTGDLSSIDSRMESNVDGTNRNDYTHPVDTCHGIRTKQHPSDARCEVVRP
mmetsp:Transcript_6755/g.16770  ORF Transcript_6755/g.16770 Transcript_6755/m.16770 type:complete len:374 (-) Transcript_6755:1380-2501(-)